MEYLTPGEIALRMGTGLAAACGLKARMREVLAVRSMGLILVEAGK